MNMQVKYLDLDQEMGTFDQEKVVLIQEDSPTR